MDELQNRPIYPCTILVIVANCGGFNAEEIWIDTSPRYIFQPETFSNGIGWRVKYDRTRNGDCELWEANCFREI